MEFNVCDNDRITGKILVKHKYHEETWSFEEMYIARELRFFHSPFYQRMLFGYMLVMFLAAIRKKRNWSVTKKYTRYNFFLTPTFPETDQNKKLFDICSHNTFYLNVLM